MAQVPQVKLNNGKIIPGIGLGTWQGPPGKEGEVGDAVKLAIDLGYRHFDCAHVYKNEQIVGEAIAVKITQGVVKREDLFVTSKLWNTYHRPDLVETGLKQTLQHLGLEYLDLYLMHWPFAFKEGEVLYPEDPNDPGHCHVSDVDYVDTWKVMETLVQKGLIKSIGISNFNSGQIERLIKNAKILPVTNQIECYPYLNQKKLREFCKSKNMIVTAYSPLGSPSRPWAKPNDPDILNVPKLKSIAEKYNKTPAQILLRYQIELGTIPIPKSSNRQRLAENMNIFDFELAIDDVDYLNTFDCNGRVVPNDFASKHPLYPFNAEF